MASEQNAVYCTLLLTDHYLPGAMVLAHSLRDNGTRAKLVALFTPDSLRQETIEELRTIYDELIAVHSFINGRPANLWLMDRPDLIATFTKIELWRLTQFDRIVYIDCDVVALRAPDELFSLEVNFAAAPDVGWPDCFNSGLMALRPNMQDYYALKALAERGISFDGADQGLLNMHFRDWHRLSFTYNCTPSANYQYIPAYKHFQSTISLIHFIGSQKPWNMPRHVAPLDSPYNQLLNNWWAVYDRHYHPHLTPTQNPFHVPEPPIILQDSSNIAPSDAIQIWPDPQQVHHTEDPSKNSHHDYVHSADTMSTSESPSAPGEQLSSQQEHSSHAASHGHETIHQAAHSTDRPVLSIVPHYVRGEEHVSTYVPSQPGPPAPVHQIDPSVEGQGAAHEHHEHHEQSHNTTHIHHTQPVPPPPATEVFHRPPSPEPESPKFEAPKAEWDASREPPPLNTKPEGISLQQKTYIMSEDTKLFQPPPSYPEAPKNMYYQVPTAKPEPQNISQIFPWEQHAPKPTRVFADEQSPPSPVPAELPSTPEPSAPNPALAALETTPTRVPFEPSAESWDSYSRSNAWDEDPSIQRYIESIQAARRAKTQVLTGGSTQTSPETQTTSTTGHRPSILLTDFPTEVERPSLPVTPAPVERRASNNDNDQDYISTMSLPAAEGVPDQEDWNPLARLEELRRRQSEGLLLPGLFNAGQRRSHAGSDSEEGS